jgi:hypothetical protein
VPGGIVEIDGAVAYIAVSIPTLRIGQVRNDGIRLKEAVDIRRNRP